MNGFPTFCRQFRWTIALIIVISNLSGHSLEALDDQAYSTQIMGQLSDHQIAEQSTHGMRFRRWTFNLMEYLADMRKKRNITWVLPTQMKFWINWEKSKQEAKSSEADGGEQVISSETPPLAKVTSRSDPSANNTIVYKDKEFKALCDDPVFTAVDSSLDGSEIIIFKNDKFYLMEELKYGSGNLVTSGKTSDLLPGFDPKGFDAMMTIKEGQMRGFTFAFYKNTERSGWTPTGYTRIRHVNEFKKKALNVFPKDGFDVVLHNRDLTNPLMIGMREKMVYYYKTENKDFKKVKEVTHDKSDEKFPPDITAGFSMPNGYVYLFQNKRYCARELMYEVKDKDVYCDVWMDNKIFLGCYGKYPPPYSMEAEKIENYGANVLEINEERDSLCDSLKDIKFDKSVDGLTILAFSGNKYWTIEHFPENPVITKSNITSEKWRGFHSSPDTVLLVPEGQHLRGTLFEFKGGKYSQWGTTGKLLGKDQQSVKFKTIIHNSDVVEPVAVAFDKEEVHYFNTDSKTLTLNKTVNYSETEEFWPKGITNGLTMNANKIFLFRGDTYCLREWNCADSKTNCCKKWFLAKELFGCSS